MQRKRSNFWKKEKAKNRFDTSELEVSQNALCMQHRDEIRNNDPLQSVIKQLGSVFSPCRPSYFGSADLGCSHAGSVSSFVYLRCDDVENVAHI